MSIFFRTAFLQGPAQVEKDMVAGAMRDTSTHPLGVSTVGTLASLFIQFFFLCQLSLPIIVGCNVFLQQCASFGFVLALDFPRSSLSFFLSFFVREVSEAASHAEFHPIRPMGSQVLQFCIFSLSTIPRLQELGSLHPFSAAKPRKVVRTMQKSGGYRSDLSRRPGHRYFATRWLSLLRYFDTTDEKIGQFGTFSAELALQHS